MRQLGHQPILSLRGGTSTGSFIRLRRQMYAFVWCPGIRSGAGGSFSQWYPGNKYVNWIAVDGYDFNNNGPNALNVNFAKWYATWQRHDKPMMIAETAATPRDQVAYLHEVQQQFPSRYPAVKAFVYFDSTTRKTHGDWTLKGAGLKEFKDLAQSPYFSF